MGDAQKHFRSSTNLILANSFPPAHCIGARATHHGCSNVDFDSNCLFPLRPLGPQGGGLGGPRSGGRAGVPGGRQAGGVQPERCKIGGGPAADRWSLLHIYLSVYLSIYVYSYTHTKNVMSK